uniref:Uncharacterized protein n=1 Tax=Branchiostoma floridae TaxID=7739 RepID=C3YP08_BRAFL|eukprot:XP_002601887.1 hypothetical protein BRAFLDRAFT_86364 [Branchiostoma floridae]
MSWSTLQTLTPALNHPHLAKLLAGSLGGMSAVILTYPLDMVRVRLMFQVKGEHLYEGIWHTFRTIWAQEGGVLRLSTGASYTSYPHRHGPLLRQVVCRSSPLTCRDPFCPAGLSFFTFDTLKQLLLDSGPRALLQHGGETDDRALRAPVNLVLGGVAGAIAQTASGCVKTLLAVYRTDGVKHGLYRGISVNYLRVIPQVAMSFCVYEMCKQLLKMEQPAQNKNSQQPAQNKNSQHPAQNKNSQHPAQNKSSDSQNPTQNSKRS